MVADVAPVRPLTGGDTWHGCRAHFWIEWTSASTCIRRAGWTWQRRTCATLHRFVTVSLRRARGRAGGSTEHPGA